MLKVAGIKWAVRKGYEPIILKVSFAENTEGKLAPFARGDIIKDSSIRKVYRASVPYAQETLPVVVKIYKHKIKKLHDLKYLRVPKGIAEYLKARELEKRGVPTLFALAGGARRRYLIPIEHFFISREIVGGRTLREFVNEDFPSLGAEERFVIKRKLIRALASFVKGFHERGVLQKDLHLSNIVFTRSSEGDFRFFLVDIVSVKVKRRLRLSQRLKNLAKLSTRFKGVSSGADRFRFFKIYAQGDEKIESHLKKYARIVEKQIWRYQSHKRRKYLRRAFSTNRFFAKVQKGRIKGFFRREFKTAHSPFMQNPAAFFDPDKVKLLKAGRRTTVAEGKITVDGEVKDIVIKRYNQKKWIDPFKDLFRHSRAFKAWKIANALFYSDFPVALPMGVFEERRLRWLRHSYLVMEKLKAMKLSEFLQEEFGPVQASGAKPDEVKKKRIILSALARLIRHLHNQGFAHRDLKFTNIFVTSDSPNPISNTPVSFYIIDYDAYSLNRRVSKRLRKRDLSRMELAASKLEGVVSRTERMRFLKSYLADIKPGKSTFKTWGQDILRRAEKKGR
ncbi:MAG: hypothetical protein AMS15_02805 [Planctomycetes bacterium DG_23]|nr:MAG: hypothetical protein AMS15_02805 [Planctomycetes bacterium DG_23]